MSTPNIDDEIGTEAATWQLAKWVGGATVLAVALFFFPYYAPLVGIGAQPASETASETYVPDSRTASDEVTDDERASDDGAAEEEEQSPAESDGEQPGPEKPEETANGAATSGFERAAHLEAAQNGHFYAEAYLNDRPVQVIVDTGATGVALTYEDAERIGIHVSDADYTHRSQTANGTAKIAPVKLEEIRIGDVVVKDVDAFVAEPGALFGTLLGMTFLSRLSRVDFSGRELTLVQ